LQVSWVKLLGAQESYIREIPAILLPAQKSSGIRAVIHVPSRTLPSTFNVVIMLQLAGNAAGVLPDLTFRYRNIPRAPDAEEVGEGSALIGIPSVDQTGVITS